MKNSSYLLATLLLIGVLFVAGCTQQQVQTNIPIQKNTTPSSQPTPPSLPEPAPELQTQPQNDTNDTITPQKNTTDVEVNATASAPIQTPVETTPPPPEPPEPKLINGKTVEERLQEASDRLHTSGSGPHIRNNFPDIELVYTDDARGKGFPQMILPFRYYYSEEANTTFNICNIELTVFICKGKLDNLITNEDLYSSRCEVTPVYTGYSYGGY
ncbi:hypothetical protein HY570_03605 [Candidatus Micrarchaeota archaeon]|nr:hypothetical protein [Candidatus Micrarchaeota archaeon]